MILTRTYSRIAIALGPGVRVRNEEDEPNHPRFKQDQSPQGKGLQFMKEALDHVGKKIQEEYNKDPQGWNVNQIKQENRLREYEQDTEEKKHQFNAKQFGDLWQAIAAYDWALALVKSDRSIPGLPYADQRKAQWGHLLAQAKQQLIPALKRYQKEAGDHDFNMIHGVVDTYPRFLDANALQALQQHYGWRPNTEHGVPTAWQMDIGMELRQIERQLGG